MLKINDEILEERDIVDALYYDFEQNKDFDEADVYYIEKLAEKYDVSMPMIREINRVLFDDKDPSDAVADLMLRDRKAE